MVFALICLIRHVQKVWMFRFLPRVYAYPSWVDSPRKRILEKWCYIPIDWSITLRQMIHCICCSWPYFSCEWKVDWLVAFTLIVFLHIVLSSCSQYALENCWKVDVASKVMQPLLKYIWTGHNPLLTSLWNWWSGIRCLVGSNEEGSLCCS